MKQRRDKRLYTPNQRMKKMLEYLGPEMMEYFDDLRPSKKLKKKDNVKGNFSVGEIVTVGNSHGTIIYGPYKAENKKVQYEIEMEDGDIITVEDDGEKIVKYASQEEDIEEDDF